MATFTSMAGSLFGSCSCFIMGRYIMRDRVRRWGRKYPLFDAIDLGKIRFFFNCVSSALMHGFLGNSSSSKFSWQNSHD